MNAQGGGRFKNVVAVFLQGQPDFLVAGHAPGLSRRLPGLPSLFQDVAQAWFLQMHMPLRAEHHIAFNDGLQFADVAVPLPLQQDFQGLGRDLARNFAVFGAELFKKNPGQIPDVAPAFPQAGDVQAQNVQPVIEILAKSPLSHRLLQLLVGG